MKKLVVICLTVLSFSGMALAGGMVAFDFNPVDFFNYQPVGDDTRGLDGGMFRLHQTWGGNMYNSWQSSTRATVDDFKAGLGAGEGIGCFNIWLADQANAPLWGETLISSGSVKPTGYAPTGWTAEVVGNPWPAGGNGYWLVQWYTTNPDLYIRPGNNVGDFGFSFSPTTAVTAGENYTLWFGGSNYGTGSTAQDSQALYFDNFGGTNGFASQYVSAWGSGFEATLNLTAIPEPTTMLLLGLGSLFCARCKKK
jgi:hypothetical protein